MHVMYRLFSERTTQGLRFGLVRIEIEAAPPYNGYTPCVPPLQRYDVVASCLRRRASQTQALCTSASYKREDRVELTLLIIVFVKCKCSLNQKHFWSMRWGRRRPEYGWLILGPPWLKLPIRRKSGLWKMVWQLFRARWFCRFDDWLRWISASHSYNVERKEFDLRHWSWSHGLRLSESPVVCVFEKRVRTHARNSLGGVTGPVGCSWSCFR